jgi:hypothetical protein
MTQTTQRSLLNQAGNQNSDTVGLDNAPSDQGAAPTSEQPNHDWEKRYKDLQSFNSRKINELTNQIKTLQEQGVPKVTAPRTPEEMDAFKAANPEMYNVIQHMATEIAQTQLQGYDQKMAGVQNDLLDTKMEKAQLAIKAAHPDFEQVINSDQFAAWASRQAAGVQDWIYNNPDNPDLAIKALSLYKYESGQNTTTSQLDASVDVAAQSGAATETNSRNHPAYIWKASDIRGMPPAEYAKWDEVITLAHREGRVSNT